jgi:putative membrane-bound dehydrogenase-like protein
MKNERTTTGLVLILVFLLVPRVRGDDEALLFTPAGFDRSGEPASASGEATARLHIVVRDQATGRQTPCRMNVVGADGRFYQPAENRLTPYSLTGEWPKTGKGNRSGKAPYRYYGRFFYMTGEVDVEVPTGPVRIEVAKGFEYHPASLSCKVLPKQTTRVEMALTRMLPASELGYASGDLHLHFPRRTEDDDAVIFDLMAAEDIRFGAVLAYNEPAGPYHGVMERMDSPQFRGLGSASIRARGEYQILSGQEYRSRTFGHLNLFLRDSLVLAGQSGDADDGPPYGDLGRETRKAGGYAFYAHGGYAQAVYADIVQGAVDGVELLQFGVYRGIGLEDWYRFLNIGFRVPCIGASDYPACRALGDCRTYVVLEEKGTFPEWLQGASAGRSFVTTGPMLRLEVDGQGPGSHIKNARRVTARVRAIAVVAPITHLQLIVGGRVLEDLEVPVSEGRGNWIELRREVELPESSWIAARAFSTAPCGSPDAEAHTNPVYIDQDGKDPYRREDLDRLVERIDGQMAIQRARDFHAKAKVLDDFQKSRDILLRIRERGGLPADGVPASILEDNSAAGLDPASRTHTDEELSAFLEPLPPKTLEEALATFETVPGFHMELVASEPLVCSPVAAAFDEDGNLYVAEMRDYPFRPRPGQSPLGTVRLLRDTDGDGRFDRADVFADGLLWAAGVAPWKGGVFVAAPPDIWYFKDTDGDRKADVRRRVYTGFGVQNQQGMLNNLVYGLDHKIYGSTSSNGGTVRPADDPKAPGTPVDGRDFRFDPMTGAFESITGTLQFGTTFDDWGNRFLCSESRPLLHPVLPQHYLARNPYLPVSSAIDNIAGGPVPIFRISPIERWRQIRSSRRIAHGERPATSAGASHHVVDAGAGVTVYRGGAYPESYYGNVFLGDAQNNLVHRRTLVPDGPSFRSERADAKTEFLRSSDNWFRPVNLLNAPDGTLFVLDMGREILEAIHIPLDVVKHLDLRRGRDRGRIYRIAPDGWGATPQPRLGSARTAELVATLESPHGWWRDTAHRLIHERQDPAAIEPLRQLLRKSPSPQARLLALWSLQGLGELKASDLLAGLADVSPRLREHALRLSEPSLDRDDEIFAKVLSLVDDPDAGVRFQLAFSLGETRDRPAVPALVRLALRDATNPWLRTALLSSCTDSSESLLVELLDHDGFRKTDAGLSFLEDLAAVVGARGQAKAIQRVRASIAARVAPGETDRLVLGLGRGLRVSGAHLSADGDPWLARLFERSRASALDPGAPEALRIRSVLLLGCGTFAVARETLAMLLGASQPQSVQTAALRALAAYHESEVAAILLEHLAGFGPSARAEAIQALLARETWTVAFLGAVRAGTASAQGIEPARRTALRSSRNPEIALLARTVFATDKESPRKQVLAEYTPVLATKGDAARGARVFEQHCMTCHKVGPRGHAVGPDLTSSPSADPSALLANILDPNQSVLPKYVQYLATDQDGRTFSGLIVAETASSITLRRGDDASDTLLRSRLESLVNTGQSLMPEGLERLISKPEMADLMTFLVSAHGSGPSSEPPLDIGTTPGSLVEPGP